MISFLGMRAYIGPYFRQKCFGRKMAEYHRQFLEKNGLSVDRGDYRSDEEVKADMSKRLSGTIIKVRVSNCLETEALVKYLPSRNNKYHSEIHGSESELILSASQRRHLAMCAQIVD